jgi:hypothetical protein
VSYHASVTWNVNCATNINNGIEFPVLPVLDTARVDKLDMRVVHAFTLNTVTGLLQQYQPNDSILNIIHSVNFNFLFKVRQMYNSVTLIVHFPCPTCFEPLIWVH